MPVIVQAPFKIVGLPYIERVCGCPEYVEIKLIHGFYQISEYTVY